ncbi:leucine--tRNA ligase [Rickettsia endosymbiont of Cardiosporidium cionae]|uniref:leucine--tRNA ligase n=1 Tax=Rickettsia endosymbiont of Cardiosporidium cionae TaxID=2777155 RepID=UPI001894F295|nr:leucine--tRNA ligase [Rickettsia endosymbiont of Cardiosporidium cionae]
MKSIEEKWQKLWQYNNAFKASRDFSKKKSYILEMFPYPSGKIHVGHVRNYAIGDVIARFMRSCGYNVLYPMGWDAFGLPAENAAILNQSHPKGWTYSNIESMKSQLKKIGLSYDWSRELSTSDSDYYQYEQEFFLELYKRGLAYQKYVLVNWDPVDNTVLANEQVVDGMGWRSGVRVEKKHLKQWLVKITDYAEELLVDLETLTQWPDNVKNMQKNWIGKSEGVELEFNIEKFSGKTVKVFSTKPETIFGASFVAIAYNHPFIQQVYEQSDGVIKSIIDQFIKDTMKELLEMNHANKQQVNAVFTGLYAIHPFDNSIKLPIMIANYVLMDYGTGAIFGCSAHDTRDYELACIINKLGDLNIDIKQVISAIDSDNDPLTLPFVKYDDDNSYLINSGFINKLSLIEARSVLIQKIEELGIGKKATYYKLRDWLVSRQRYWGTPIPIIYCDFCGIVPVPIKDLPVELPYDIKLDGHGNPLDNHPSWKYVSCPKCYDKNARRETDTFDTFFDSSWYFLRFCSPQHNSMLDTSEVDYWFPVDKYIGGIEHAVLHLLYSRFFTKVMCDIGYIKVREPFISLTTQGMVLSNTYKDSNNNWVYPSDVVKHNGELVHIKSGLRVIEGKIEKMSKSKLNVIDLDSTINQYGADVVRMFLLSDTPINNDILWSQKSVVAIQKFIQKLFNITNIIFFDKTLSTQNISDKQLDSIVNLTIKNVTEYIENIHLNKALAQIRILFNSISESLVKLDVSRDLLKQSIKILIQLLNPFVPHITEELWQLTGSSSYLTDQLWPKYDPVKIKSNLYVLAVQINGKLRTTCNFDISSTEEVIKQTVLNLDIVKKHLVDGPKIKKIIIVPKKICNLVLY